MYQDRNSNRVRNRRKFFSGLAAAAIGTTTLSGTANAEPSTIMVEGFLGEVRMFAGNFAPRGWALCDGQFLPISQNTALFSLLGTLYGGDGRTTFGLPDLRGRVPLHPGSGPGLSARRLGEKGGTETISERAGAGTGDMAVSAAGSSNMSPYLGINFIICLQGIFPSRS